MTTSVLQKMDYNYCALPLAAYACRPDQSLGRVFAEPESRFRTPFQRDRDRIIHSSAFRRLKYKTQVFVYHEGDHYRTRLTHTLEVSQVARTLARALMVNEDLAEAVALAHDLGHTPFAHVGEDYLAKCMEPFGGFDHNDQSLRVLTTLERKYPKWNGLNLTWETLEGVVKHNGPVTGMPHIAVAELQGRVDLRLSTYASVEAQVAALSDDIAYNNHDVEDGLRAGLFTLDDLEDIPILHGAMERVRAASG
ncbi:MAG: dNTP triphosphohydrolase, partial [Alphaproteobacteria bacterium]